MSLPFTIASPPLTPYVENLIRFLKPNLPALLPTPLTHQTAFQQVLVNAAHSVFLCRGQDKVDVFESTVSSTETHNRYPAKPVVQKSPTTIIFDR